MVPRIMSLLLLKQWNQTRANSHFCFPFVFVTDFMSPEHMEISTSLKNLLQENSLR